MRLVFLFGLLLWGAGLPVAQAQRVLLHANVAEDTTYTTYGPNRRYFIHPYLSYALVVGAPSAPGAALHYGRSAELAFGLRGKRRLSQTVAVGIDLRYAYLIYSLKQNDQKILPTPAQHYREQLTLQQLQGEGYVRLHYGRRGNAIGRYLDLTGWGGWVLASAHTYEDRPGPQGTKKKQVAERGLRYVQRWPYGVGARLGNGRYALVGRYRLSDTFAGSAPPYPELPRWMVGLELGWL